MSSIAQNANLGWQNQPNERGTFDIIKTCAGTIFLLCWSSVCPNVPSLKTGRWSQMGARLELFLLAILGPDFTFMIALGQLNEAYNAKKIFHAKGHKSWNLRQCYFVNMGGIHVQFPDRRAAGRSSFPVDCHQLLHLVECKYIALPNITEDIIEERNKTDDLARAITLVQCLWFTVETLGRLAQGLHTTTLELTTLAFVFLMAGCAVCWWRKPMDISRPIVIDVSTDLSVVLEEFSRNAPTPPAPYDRTPLSFLNRREWFMSQFWFYYTQILRNMRLMPKRTTKPGEADHFESVEFPEIDLKFEVFGAGPLVMMYSGIFLAAWNFEFPTTIERTLWQAAGIICLAYGAVGCALAWSWHNVELLRGLVSKISRPFRKGNDDGLNISEKGLVQRLGTFLRLPALPLHQISQWFNWMRNLSPENDPALAVPVRLWIPTTILCVAYCLARGYILIEDIIGLRSLPASAYSTVNWSQFSPIL